MRFTLGFAGRGSEMRFLLTAVLSFLFKRRCERRKVSSVNRLGPPSLDKCHRSTVWHRRAIDTVLPFLNRKEKENEKGNRQASRQTGELYVAVPSAAPCHRSREAPGERAPGEQMRIYGDALEMFTINPFLRAVNC